MKRFTPECLVPLIAALLALLSGITVLSQGTTLADGSPVLPLDDAYIHLQYGWQTAQGDILRYNSADVPTTGATSLLYMLLLGAGFAAGISKAAMPVWMLGFGLVLFPIAAAFVADTTRRIALLIQRDAAAPARIPAWGVGLLSGVLFAGSGWMAWVYLTGMETGLAITLIAVVLWATVQRRAGLAGVFLALALLTRPEMLILGVVLLGGELILPQPDDDHRWRRLVILALPLLAAGVPYLLNNALSGSASATGFLAKSMLTYVPFYWQDFVSTVGETMLIIVLGTFGGWPVDGYWYVMPLLQVLAVMGGIWLWRRGSTLLRRLALVLAGWIVLHLGATATLQTATWHHHRYQTVLYPGLVLLAAPGLTWLAERIAVWVSARLHAPARTVAAALLAIIGLGWGVISVGIFARSYALDVYTTQHIQIAAGQWLHDHTPSDAVVAISDAGAQRFFGERYTFDIVGLTSEGMFDEYRAGPGAIYETLETLAPDYYVIYPEVVAPYFGLADAPALFGDVLYTAQAQPWSTIAAAMDRQLVTQPDWSGAVLAAQPQQANVTGRIAAEGWSPVDALDVADLADEEAHAYDWWLSGRPPGFATYVRQMNYRTDGAITLADGGRILNAGMRVTLATPEAGPLLLVMRLHEQYPYVLEVVVEGEAVGIWRLPAVPGEWQEQTFTIPAEYIQGPATTIELRAWEPFNPAEEARFEPYHLWAYMGGAVAATPEPETAQDALFAGVATLTGYDLPTRTFAPGDVIPLALHLQAPDPNPTTPADMRLFVHVMDPAADSAEGIVAQFDGQPGQGTRPFWTWPDGAAQVVDAAIALPADLPPGEYVLLLGIYNGESFARAPLGNADDYGDNRLSLGTITVTGE